MGNFWGGEWLKKFLGSTHIVEQLSFSMFLSILTFELDLILGSFLLFGALMGYGVGYDNCFGVYSCSWITFLFHMFPSILIYVFT